MLTARIKHHALAIFGTLTIALTFAIASLPLPGKAVRVVMVFVPSFVGILPRIQDARAGQRLGGK